MFKAFTAKENAIDESESQILSWFEYFFIFVLVIYAGRANTFVESSSIKDNPAGALLPILLSGIIAIKWKIKFDGRFFFLIFCFLVYFVAISMKYSEIHPSFFLTYIFKFFVVYVVIKSLKFNLFKIYEVVLFYLAIIGLLFYGVQVVLGGDTLFSYFAKIPGMQLFSYVTGDGLNAIIYSVQPTEYSLITFPIPRNSGFAQEPGSFAIYLCLAIFINLFFTKSDKLSKQRFWLLVVALISTQSTTGYVIFMVIIVYYIMNENLNKMLLLLPVALVALIYVSTLPFMRDKIVGLINETNDLDMMVESTIGREEASTPQRFTSFMITFVDFKKTPILGLGPDGEKSWTNRIGARISPISGIGNLMAQFGIIGLFFFIIFSLRSSFFLARYYNYNGKLLLFIIIFFISVSYLVIILPLLMCFWLFELFAPGIDTEKTELREILVYNKPVTKS
jgi:hypothetical protein